MTTQPYEIAAWLGDDWSDDQIQSITDEYRRLERKLDLDEEESEALLTIIAQRVDGTVRCERGARCECRDHWPKARLRAHIRANEAKRARREVT